MSVNTLSSLDSIGITSHRTVTLYCEHCGHAVAVRLKCSDRTCPECRRRIYFKLFNGWLKLVESMENPKLLTLTLVNKDFLSREHVRSIRRYFIRLIRRKYYKDRVSGGLYVIEVTNKGRGWNIHLHALIDTLSGNQGFLAQNRISNDWRDITKDSWIVHIKKADNPRKGLSYILKYFIKPPKIHGENNTYNSVLKRSRLIQTFGGLYGSKPEKQSLVCEKCGGTAWMSEFEQRRILKNFREIKITYNCANYN